MIQYIKTTAVDHIENAAKEFVEERLISISDFA